MRMVFLILALIWLLLFVLLFRSPGAPTVPRLFIFLGWLGVSLVLGYFFLVNVIGWNPNPLRVDLARTLTKNKMIYLGDFVPGLYDLDYIHRVDTDGEQEEILEEWVTFYKYDVGTDQTSGRRAGPYGAAIYDYNRCRPPTVLSFELVPVNYDYLGQNWADVGASNFISYADPSSGGQDRPEVVIRGYTRGVVTDLNLFRKVGVDPTCLELQQWLTTRPGEAYPGATSYDSIGSFRGNVSVERDGSIVTTVDRSPFERSQISIRRSYSPVNGSYYRPGTQVLLDPVETSLALGPGIPDDVPQVYYPEKAVLAFYANLTKDSAQLEEAQSYLSPYAQDIYDMRTDPFGLSIDPESPATARKDLARVLTWEIRYEPDVEAEQLHEDRDVTVLVTGVNNQGQIDTSHPCEVTWTVVGMENPQALPYGCEWRLESYWTNCLSAGASGGVGK
jgi:hypothetical protein